MKNFFLKISACTIFLFCAQNFYAQNDSGQVYTWVERNPSYPGGESELLKFLKTNITYPEYEKQNNIQGTVWIGFIVYKNGSVGNFREIRGVKNGSNLTREAIRVLKEMPAWTPGVIDGRPVDCMFQIPVKYTLKPDVTKSVTLESSTLTNEESSSKANKNK